MAQVKDIKRIRPEDKTPELLMELFGMERAEAEFILAVERGETEGDVVVLDPKDVESSRR